MATIWIFFWVLVATQSHLHAEARWSSVLDEWLRVPSPYNYWAGNFGSAIMPGSAVKHDTDVSTPNLVNRAISDLAGLSVANQRRVLGRLEHIAPAAHFDYEKLDFIAIAKGAQPVICKAYGDTKPYDGTQRLVWFTRSKDRKGISFSGVGWPSEPGGQLQPFVPQPSITSPPPYLAKLIREGYFDLSVGYWKRGIAPKPYEGKRLPPRKAVSWR